MLGKKSSLMVLKAELQKHGVNSYLFAKILCVIIRGVPNIRLHIRIQVDSAILNV
jgi:hypothetical protein